MNQSKNNSLWIRIFSFLLTLSAVGFALTSTYASYVNHSDSLPSTNTNLNIVYVFDNELKLFNIPGATWHNTVASIPYGEAYRGFNDAKSVITDENENYYYIINGIEAPYLSIFDQINGTWEHYTVPDWGVSGTIYFGGIAKHQNSIFLTDLEGEIGQTGVIKFDLITKQFSPFIQTVHPSDLSMGLDGLLYVYNLLDGNIYVYNPETAGLIKTIIPSENQDFRGIAVNQSGELFLTTFNEVFHFDNEGLLINSINGPFVSLGDIAIHTSGKIAVGQTYGDYIGLTDESLQSWQVYDVSEPNRSSPPIFLTFVEKPIISSEYLPILQNLPTLTPTPTLVLSPTPSPTPLTPIESGQWFSPISSEGFVSFYVSDNSAYVWGLRVLDTIPGCGGVEIYLYDNPQITNGNPYQFSFDDGFYIYGYFDTYTTAHGQYGLNNVYIEDCNITVDFGPIDWIATLGGVDPELVPSFEFPSMSYSQEIKFEIKVIK